MKRHHSMIEGVAIAILIGFVGLIPVFGESSPTVISVPGKTSVQDPSGDFLLKNCDPHRPHMACSLPPDAPLALPGYFDIRAASITEIGGGQVELSISLYESIPHHPNVPRLFYAWQFQDGCVEPSPTNKEGIHIFWNGDQKSWGANWYIVTNCNPRTINQGEAVPFEFTADGIRVRVKLSDLLDHGNSPGSDLRWYAFVRRLPFSHPNFRRTLPVDVAPDVIAFNPNPPPDLINPKEFATWKPRPH